MTSIGRGRGWLQNDRNPLPKPGRPACHEDVNDTDIVNLISLVDDENLTEKVDEIAKLVNDKVKEQNLKSIPEKICNRALNDKDFGLKLLKVYNSSAFKNIYDSEKKSLHLHLVRFLQVNYERRKNLREENVTHFRNAICLFSEYLSCIISSTGNNFFRKLQLALLDYMEMLMDTASVEDVKIFAEQMVVHGKHFHSSCREEMDNLMITVRQKLIEENLSVTSRRMLLYVIDLESRNFDSLPDSLRKFYKFQLENDFKQADNNVIIESLTKAQDVVEHNSSKNELKDQQRESKLVKNRSLRAIRGSGAADSENSVAAINKLII